MPREFARKHRVAAEIQRLLNELLLAEVKDPRLTSARVSDVEVTGDLSLATIHFNTLGSTTIRRRSKKASSKRGASSARASRVLCSCAACRSCASATTRALDVPSRSAS